MVESHYEALWADNSEEKLGRHPIENYSEGLYDAEKQAIISQQCRRSKMIGLWIKNYLTTDPKHKLRAFKYAYTFNAQYDGDTMLFVFVKMVRPDTCAGCSYIKYKLEIMKISHFKHDILKANLHIAKWTNKITIAGETY